MAEILIWVGVLYRLEKKPPLKGVSLLVELENGGGYTGIVEMPEAFCCQ